MLRLLILALPLFAVIACGPQKKIVGGQDGGMGDGGLSCATDWDCPANQVCAPTALCQQSCNLSPMIFSTPQYLMDAGMPMGGLVAGDFNGDGRDDLAATPQGTEQHVGVMLGRGDGTFDPMQFWPTGGGAPVALAVIDFNSDGKDDLVASTGTELISWLSSVPGDGLLMPVLPPHRVTAPHGITSLTVGKIDGDAVDDVAVVDTAPALSATLFQGSADGTLTIASARAVGNAPQSLTLADLNGDGRNDLVVTNYREDSVSVLLQQGAGFSSQVKYATGPSPTSVKAADLDGDSALDLLVVQSGTPGMAVLKGKGDGTFAPLVRYSTLVPAHQAYVMDLNRDSKPDVIITSQTNLDPSNPVGILSFAVALMNGGPKVGFSAPTNLSLVPLVGTGSSSYAIGDFNRDGNPDLASPFALDSLSLTVGSCQ